MQGVFIKGLALLHFGLGGGADLDLGHAAGQLGQPFLQLFPVVFAVGRGDLAANHLAAAIDGFLVADAFGDGRILGIDLDLLGPAKVAELDIFHLDAQVLENSLAAGQGGDVFQHGLAAVAVAGRFNRANLQNPLQLVHHQRGQRFALDILGNDQQRLFLLGNGFQKRNQVLGGGDFLFVNEDVGILQFGDHGILVGDKMGGQVTAIELHALHDDDFGIGGLAFLDGDDAVGGADQLHGLGQLFADLGVIVGGDGGDLGDFLFVLVVDLLSQSVELTDDLLDRLLDAAGQGHGIGAGGDALEAFAVNGLGENGGGSGAVAGHVAGLAGRFFDQLGAHVLVGVLQLDFLGHGDAVLGNVRTSPTFVDNRIAAARSQGAAHRPRQLADARE